MQIISPLVILQWRIQCLVVINKGNALVRGTNSVASGGGGGGGGGENGNQKMLKMTSKALQNPYFVSKGYIVYKYQQNRSLTTKL